MRVSSAQSAQSGSFCRMRFTRVRFLFVRQTPLAAPRTRALRTDWTSSVSYSLQTAAQHAEESKDGENHIVGILCQKRVLSCHSGSPDALFHLLSLSRFPSHPVVFISVFCQCSEVFAACAIRARVFFSCVRRRLRPQGRAHSARIGLHRSHIRCRRPPSTQRSP